MREGPTLEQDILTRLHGRRILVLGRESETKKFLTEELRDMGRRTEDGFEVLSQGDIEPEDYVILMGTAGESRRVPRERGTQKYPWIREKKERGEYLKSWTEFRALTDVLQTIRRVKPAAAVFVSDSSIYGKLFGEPHLLREEEIGYLCHTDEDSQDAQTLRMTEHLCARLAREDGVDIRIARLQNPTQGTAGSGDNVPDMTGMLLRALLFGTAGEPYNIPGPWQVSGEMEEVSPLSPNMVVEELAKIKSL